MEWRRCSLDREGWWKPCVKAVIFHFGEITVLGFGQPKNTYKVWQQALVKTARPWKEGQQRTRTEELEKRCSIGGYA